jgi:hypothetical protein
VRDQRVVVVTVAAYHSVENVVTCILALVRGSNVLEVISSREPQDIGIPANQQALLLGPVPPILSSHCLNNVNAITR